MASQADAPTAGHRITAFDVDGVLVRGDPRQRRCAPLYASVSA